MSICYNSCLVSIIFIISMIYMTLRTEKHPIFDKFLSTLDEKQRETYKEIAMERRTNYFYGFLIGMFISIAFIIFNSYNKIKMSRLHIACIVASISFVVSYFYYLLVPKKTYMISHLVNDEQRKEWLGVYRFMQYHYHLSLFLGIIGVTLFSISFC